MRCIYRMINILMRNLTNNFEYNQFFKEKKTNVKE